MRVRQLELALTIDHDVVVNRVEIGAPVSYHHPQALARPIASAAPRWMEQQQQGGEGHGWRRLHPQSWFYLRVQPFRRVQHPNKKEGLVEDPGDSYPENNNGAGSASHYASGEGGGVSAAAQFMLLEIQTGLLWFTRDTVTYKSPL